MTEKLYRVIVSHPKRTQTQKRLEAPQEAEGYYLREVSADGMTITYRKVA